MAVVPLYNSSAAVEAVALRALYTVCPTIFDAGQPFNGALWVPEWPPAPTLFAGGSLPLSFIPLDGRWSCRASNEEQMPMNPPSVWVQSGAPTHEEYLDGMTTYVGVPVVAYYRGRRDDSGGIIAGSAQLRAKAESAALAMAYALRVHIPQVAVALDPTNRFGIMYVEDDGVPVADEAGSSAPDNMDTERRSLDYCDAAVRVIVYQHRRDDQGTT